jgi:D-arabinose 1-dehydrogenase-like Zn-dependent alcohol dehydrogenase
VKAYQVVEFSQPLRCVEVASPQPAGAEVLVRVRGAGVCHSDVHIWEGGYDLGQGRRLSLKDRGISLPLTMGHETAGEIIAVGDEVRQRRIGENCLVYPWIGCGRCGICRDGYENLCMQPRCLGIHCDGGYAETVLVPHERYLLPIGDLDPAVLAPYACSGLTVFSALKKVENQMRDGLIVLIGAGGLGLMAVNILKAMGGKGAVVVDIDERKLQAARAAGAVHAVDGAAATVMEDVRAALGGPAWAVIDLVGSPQTAALAFDLLAKGGKMVAVGLFGGSSPWSLPLIPIKAATIQGSYTGSLGELAELLDLVRSGAVAPIPIDRRPLEEAFACLEGVRRGRQLGRAVLVPG